ncbi:MAG: hypothetical protein M1444_01665 [Patescibacteria group bacterium]|nr:hypothetical protein [Patescibacteria group bacterium]
MFKFRSKIYDYIAIWAIAIIVLLIYLTSLKGNFWVSGWDNLHPEFNYLSNLSRAFFSSWQEYQGLGLPAGHGHATELLRELMLWFLNIFLPTIAIRKIYIIASLLTGALGVYFFIRNVLLKNVSYETRIILSFTASSFYILNLVTIQMFYIPYEAFVAHFAFLPWMIYSIYIFMRYPSRKTFLVFLIIQLLGTWQFYIPTLFVVYMFIVFIISVSISIQNKFSNSWKILLLTLLGILLVNLYWFFPFIYYTLTNISSQREAYLNLLYTQNAYIENAKFGYLQDAALFKGFLFNNISFLNNREFGYIMGPWKDYASQWYFLIIGYSFFTISILGVLSELRKKRNIYLILLFTVFFSFLANQVYPFKIINDLLRIFPLLEEIFRNPFTKFANSALFFMIIFFTYGLLQIINWLETKSALHIKNKLYIPLAILITYFVLINIYMLPLWKGNLIYPSLKVNIPNEYFQTFNYFSHQANGRIANLPQFTPNGWDYYKWGFQGSGFIWYGINQPILDRAFDVWNKDNENYYWEISQAIYSENLALLEDILEKYQINWLLVDENITTPGSAKILYTDKIEAMLGRSNKISLAKQFGHLKIYQIRLSSNPDNFIFTATSLPNIKPTIQWGDRDQGYIDYGNYINTNSYLGSDANVFYPFRSLFTGRGQKDIAFNLQEENDHFILKSTIPKEFYNSVLVVPPVGKDESLEIDKNDLTKIATREPTLLINTKELKINNSASESAFSLQLNNSDKYELKILIPKINGYYSNNAIVSSQLAEIKPSNCNQFNKGFLSIDRAQAKNGLLNLTSIHSNNCLDFNLPNLTQELTYLLSVSAKHIEGKSLFIAINNNESKREDVANYLPTLNSFTTSYFVIPPKARYGLGYNVHLDNISIDNTKTVNELGEMKINPFPYNFLTSIKITNAKTTTNKPLVEQNLDISHPNQAYYEIRGITGEKTLILSQSYNTGWRAYALKSENILNKLFPFMGGDELKNHVLVNNWENGWILDSKFDKNSRIIIVYLPQYLEFIGFMAVFIAVILMLRLKN